MPQNIPEFRFSEEALKLRQFVYEHWCTHGHGPNLRAAHEIIGEIGNFRKELCRKI